MNTTLSRVIPKTMQRLAVTVSFDVSLLLAGVGLLAIPRGDDILPVAIDTPSEVTTTMSVVPFDPVKHPGACSDRYDFKFAGGHSGADGIADEVITRTFENGRAVLEDWQREDAPHRTMRIEYDAAGRRSRAVVSLFQGRDVWVDTVRYDRAGRQVEEKHDELDGHPSSERRTYDARGRLATLSEGGNHKRYVYDGDRLVLEKIDLDGDYVPDAETTYVYADGRVSATHTHWFGNDRWNLPYDANVTFEYDEAGRVTRETDGNGLSWINTYDSAGNLLVREQRFLSQIADPTPLVRVVYTYDCW